jgi:hypothetical protein
METNPLDPAPSASTPKPAGEPQPLGDILGRLTQDLSLLARRETELAKHEIGEKLDRAKEQAATLALGGAAVFVGGLVLLGSAVLALALVLPAWAAALAVGSAVALVGMVLLLTAKAKLSRVRALPSRTLENVERDMRAIKRAAT